MKRKFILLPITLTTLAPVISLVGCGNNIEPTEIFLNKDSIDLMVGSTFKLNAVVKPDGASQDVEWSTSNPAVCSVNKGEVKGLGEGTATITAKVKGYDLSTTCEVNVTPQPKNYIVLDQYEDSSSYVSLQTQLLDEPTIYPNTIYYFKIDMTKWGGGSRKASDFSKIDFILGTQPNNDHLVKDNLEIIIDDNISLDIDMVSVEYDLDNNTYLTFNPGCFETLLSGEKSISGQFQTGDSQSSGNFLLYFRCYKK